MVEPPAQQPLAWMARIGYAARGLVFLIVGGFALVAAAGAGNRPQGVSDTMQTLFEHPLGGVLLWIIAAGLVCFAGWRLLQGFFDADRHGRTLAGLLRRSGFVISGLFYLGFAAAIVRITVVVRHESERQSAHDWTQWLMTKPLGRVLIAATAAVFVGIAIALAVRVFRAPYRRRLKARLLTRKWAVALGSFGIFTRAVVFLMIGAFLGYAAYDANSREAVGMSGVLATLQRQAYGGLLLTIAALGLIAFGLFEFLEAAARRVHVPRLGK